MLRDITIGQYYPSESRVHKLDPRTKLVCTVLYLVSLFIFRNIWGFALAALFLAAVIKISKVPFSYMIKGLRAVMILLMITVLFNLFLTNGEVLWQWHFLRITDAGLHNAVFMAIRLVFLILGASIMTLATTPTALTDGLESLLNPLKKLKVPVHEVAMMMSIALRFIPILMEETDKIMKAQMARGADMDSGNLLQKVKAMVPILVPLFVSAFRRANDLAMAMEARCYHGGSGRTKMKPLRYGRADFVAYLITILYMAGVIGIGILF